MSARVPPPAVKPAAFTGERQSDACGANDRQANGIRNKRRNRFAQKFSLARAHFGARVIERHSRASPALRKFQPLPRARDITKNLCRVLKKSPKAHDAVRFLGRKPMLAPPALQGRS